MAEDDKSLANLSREEKQALRGKSQLLSPDPKRKKYLTELLHAFASRKISFTALVKLDPKRIPQVAEMGYVKLKHGRYQEARKIFEVLTFLDHRNFFHHLALGAAYQKLKRNIDAIFQYTEVIKISPQNLNALVNRGEVYLREKLYRKAAEDFREAILLDKTGKDIYANRARSLVIALKRSLERDKKIKAGKKSEPALTRKKINPLQMMKPR